MRRHRISLEMATKFESLPGATIMVASCRLQPLWVCSVTRLTPLRHYAILQARVWGAALRRYSIAFVPIPGSSIGVLGRRVRDCLIE
jgi:hypothetical protein